MDKRTRICDFDGCDRPHKSRGWCNTHYQRWRLHGDPSINMLPERRKLCTIEDCGKPHHARGLCGTHLARLRKTGTTDLPAPESRMHRFMRQVNKTGTVPPHAPELGQCWVWEGTRDKKGYGRFSSNERGTSSLAHRWLYSNQGGKLSKGMVLDHRCHNRSCVRPSRLREITSKQNSENVSGLNAANTSGFRGAYYNKTRGVWYAKVGHNNTSWNGGPYDTAEEAGEAARLKRLELHTHNDLDRVA